MTDDTRHYMQEIARGLDTVLNGDGERRTGFVLLVFPFGEALDNRVNYISNAQRQDIVVALKEITARFEGQPEISGRA